MNYAELASPYRLPISLRASAATDAERLGTLSGRRIGVGLMHMLSHLGLRERALAAAANSGVLDAQEVDKALEAAGVKGRDTITAKLVLRDAGLLPVGERARLGL